MTHLRSHSQGEAEQRLGFAPGPGTEKPVNASRGLGGDPQPRAGLASRLRGPACAGVPGVRGSGAEALLERRVGPGLAREPESPPNMANPEPHQCPWRQSCVLSWAPGLGVARRTAALPPCSPAGGRAEAPPALCRCGNRPRDEPHTPGHGGGGGVRLCEGRLSAGGGAWGWAGAG